MGSGLDIPANCATIGAQPRRTRDERDNRHVKQHIRRILGLGERVDLRAQAAARPPLPVLWLLGKTGAGKSSVVRGLTGQAQVGDGFTPCTRTARAFDFPADHPVLRFLDTRGLGETGYDPSEDLAVAESGSHAVLAVARLDDPAQGALREVLADLRQRRRRLPVLVLHTGADLLDDPATRTRAQAAAQAGLERAAGGALPAVTLALPEGAPPEGLDHLRAALVEMLPDLTLLMAQDRAADAEAARFAELRPLVLWYAGAAGASDAAPVIGTVTVPALQGAMLHALAARQGLRWTGARAAAFGAALGTGVVLRMTLAHGARQVAKLVPVVGQTLGAAAAAAISFAATYALGRAGAYWLHRTARGEATDAATLRAIYAEAFRRARDVAR